MRFAPDPISDYLEPSYGSECAVRPEWADALLGISIARRSAIAVGASARWSMAGCSLPNRANHTTW